MSGIIARNQRSGSNVVAGDQRFFAAALISVSLTPDPLIVSTGASEGTFIDVDRASGASIDSIAYVSGDLGVATVDGAGVVTGVSTGSCSVTVTITASGAGLATTELSDSISVVVETGAPPPPPGLPTSSMQQAVTVVQLQVGSTTHYFSDIEYGDNLARWHKCRLVGDIGYSRGADCVLWGQRRSGSGAAVGNIELINMDGALDALAVGPVSDAEARVYRVAQSAPMTQAVQVATSVVTDLEARGEETLRVVAGDISTLLEAPLQPALYETGESDPAVVGRSRPVAIGNPLSCPIALINGVDYAYDVHDSDAFTIDLVRDSGAVLAVGTLPGEGYRVADPPVYGIELLQLPAGRVVADISATIAASESIIGSAAGDFDSDIADWTVTTDVTAGGAAGATWDTGAALLEADATGVSVSGPVVDFAFPSVLAAGATYSYSADIDLTISSAEDGLLQVQFRPDSLVPGEYVQLWLGYVSTIESISGSFVAPAAGKLFFRVGASNNATASARVDNIRLDRTASGGHVADVIRQLLARAGISSDRIDTDSIDAIAAARPWPVSYWTDSATTVGDVLQQVLDSIYGWHYITPAGQIAFGYLIPPEAADESVLTITMAMLNGGIEVYADLAPGLSTTVAGQRNFYRYGPSEFVDIVDDAERAMLSADYRVRCTATDHVGVDLRRRQGAADIVTLLDDPIHIQAAADYLSVLYPADVPRKFYRVPVLISDTAAAALKPGQKVTLQRDRFGCDAGRPLRFKKIDTRVGDDACVLLCWGSGDV